MEDIMARVLKDPGSFRVHLDNDMFFVENLRKSIHDDIAGESIDRLPEDLLRYLLDHLGIKHAIV
jgi:hypothetical protein